MRLYVGSVVSLVAMGFMAGCGSADDPASNEITGWLGEQTHFAASGSFDGEPINLRLEGDAAVAASVRVERVFAPLPGNKPDASGKWDTSKVYFAMKEFSAIVDFKGQKRLMSFGNWRRDIAAGQSLTVVPRAFGTTPAAGQTWVDIGIVEPGMIATSGIESAAESGALEVKLNTNMGATEDTFVEGGGKAGQFISLSWGPNDKVNVSITADYGPSLIAPWAPNLVKP